LGGIPAEHDFITYAVFGSFFPQLLSGPISKWDELGESLRKMALNSSLKKNCDIVQLAEGLQCIIWGVFKKLVISERLALITNEVYGGYERYSGFAILLATISFAIQLYTDFSGYTDIAIGVSQTMGIYLPDNFKCPFFAASITEFWKRWHITLGRWFKDYIFYPVQNSRFIGKIRRLAKKFGKKAGKRLPVFVSLFVLWFMTGLWHGGAWKFIIGSGLLHCFYIIGGQLYEPTKKKAIQVFCIKTDVFSYKLFLRARTFSLVCIGFIFFRAASAKTAFQMIKKVLLVHHYSLGELQALSQLLGKGSGLILIVSLVILAVHDAMEEYFMLSNTGNMTVKSWFNCQNLIFRMLCYWLLIGMITLSLNLSTSEFIYIQF